MKINATNSPKPNNKIKFKRIVWHHYDLSIVTHRKSVQCACVYRLYNFPFYSRIFFRCRKFCGFWSICRHSECNLFLSKPITVMHIACLLHNGKVLFSTFWWIFSPFIVYNNKWLLPFWYCFICFWLLPRSVIRDSLLDLTNFIYGVHSLQFHFYSIWFYCVFIFSSFAANIPSSMHCWKSWDISLNVNV